MQIENTVFDMLDINTTLPYKGGPNSITDKSDAGYTVHPWFYIQHHNIKTSFWFKNWLLPTKGSGEVCVWRFRDLKKTMDLWSSWIDRKNLSVSHEKDLFLLPNGNSHINSVFAKMRQTVLCSRVHVSFNTVSGRLSSLLDFMRPPYQKKRQSTIF